MEPRKKRKLIPISGPDGFQKSPAKPKKISVPQFASAFTPSDHTSGKSPFKAPHSSLDHQLRNSNAASLRLADVHHTREPVSAIAHATTSAGPSSISTCRDPFNAYKDMSLSKRTIHHGSRTLEEQGHPPYRASHTQPALKKLQAPDLTSILQDHGMPTKPITSMKRITSPPRLPMTDDQNKYAKHDLKTLSTTSIAKATDLSTESGNAELASILLYDQHPEIVHGDADRSEARRGLNFSPRKKRYGQQSGPQFVRNGLAARASQLLSKTRTSLTLWQREMEAQTSSFPDEDPISLSYLKPDLRLKVIEIIHSPTSHRPSKSGNITNSQTPCFAIALCRVLQSPCSSSTTSNIGLSFHTSYHTLVKVIFSNAFSVSPRSIVRNAVLFKDGVEVLVWRPWHEVKVSSPHDSMEEEAALAIDETDDHQRMPASFPMSLTTSFSSSKDDSSGFRIAETALMCSRFVLMDTYLEALTDLGSIAFSSSLI
ncbi:hypothetical protein M378DRAFT_13542 [Amanita muscaria Koide BX008]|uniref:Uncharacterized protein n=1 Tax=Amanita muscaria (strain Koide BX008) TaxID=946122 RepID=A0A0C2WY85_AMAMK|nr:hypothetical protein M378DRAFT_13542 [Amanita muscaria Koide BX008]